MPVAAVRVDWPITLSECACRLIDGGRIREPVNLLSEFGSYA